jgi:hypothetical protein
MERLRGSLRWIIVTVGVILLTSFTVDATLSPSGFSQSALGILASSAVPKALCPEGMVEISLESKILCVDQFESQPHPTCPTSVLTSAVDTRTNLDAPGCFPVSADDGTPWTFATFHQAKELCAKANKRLPTSEEWYAFALGTPDNETACNTMSPGLRQGQEGSVCVTPRGVYDAIGNAWEWVDGTVQDGTWRGRQLPESGYVVNADRDGMASLTHKETPNLDLHEDYFWSDTEGEFGILRGGFYGSGKDAGLYSVQAKTPLSLSSAAIGFRCVTDLRV